MSGIRINARQRKVIEVVLIVTAALLLLGLIIDAADQATYKTMNALYKKYGLSKNLPGSFSNVFHLGDFLAALLRSPRLYIVGVVVGLAVFVHHGPKDEKA